MVYDISVIRPQIRIDDIKIRKQSLDPARLKAIKKGLLTLHNLENTAINIYRFQITGEDNEHQRQLIAAVCNEMAHYQDFQVKLFEYGWSPSLINWTYGIVGALLGTYSRLRGRRSVLKMGIWVENRAVNHYGRLLRDIEWDEDTRKVVEKNRADEGGHIERWRRFLQAD